MCFNVKSTITNVRYINANNVGSFSCHQSFNCGQCAECLQAKQSEYMVRSDSLYKATLQQNGFCYWETFTYNDDNVPVFTGEGKFVRGVTNVTSKHNSSYFKNSVPVKDKDYIFCFSHEDFRNFMKRLRVNLRRSGYEVYKKLDTGETINNLKYFFVSEYGEKYGRPHYHCIFYVTIPNMTPDIFYQYLNKSWQLGILDIYHKDNSPKPPSEKVINGQGAINYVAKYVVKPAQYVQRLQKFMSYHSISKDCFDKFRPFHRQSRGFGIDILHQQDYDFMFETGKVRYIDTSGIHLVSIPMYIKRKMWYEQQKYTDGTPHWVLNDAGKSFIRSIVWKQIEIIEQRYNKLMELVPFDYQEYIRSILQDRDLLDLAIYNRIYKGKYLPWKGFRLPSIDVMLNNFYEHTENLDEILYDDSTLFDRSKLYRNIRDGNIVSFDKQSEQSIFTFVKNHSINQFSFHCFRDFDKLINIFKSIEEPLNKYKQDYFNANYECSKRLQKLKW